MPARVSTFFCLSDTRGFLRFGEAFSAVLSSGLGDFGFRGVRVLVGFGFESGSFAAEGMLFVEAGGIDGGEAKAPLLEGDCRVCAGSLARFLVVEMLCRVATVECRSRKRRKVVGDLCCADLPMATSILNINENVIIPVQK